MDHRENEKISEEGSPLACSISTEVRVMAASGLWQDVREGLDQAETLCEDLLREHRGIVWCGSASKGSDRPGGGRSADPRKPTVPGIDLLTWRTSSGGLCGRGGEGL